ncbi:MAG: DinB family protein [Terriglobales bacterium]
MPEELADLRAHIAGLLRGGSAHATLTQALAGLTPEVAGKKPPRAPHTCWQLLEHIRIAQQDILEFTRDPNWQSPKFPQGYWPATAAPPSAAALRRSRAALAADLEAVIALVLDSARELLTPLPHAPDNTLLREALLVADHNAYHLGQLVFARKLLGAWRAQ